MRTLIAGCVLLMMAGAASAQVYGNPPRPPLERGDRGYGRQWDGPPRDHRWERPRREGYALNRCSWRDGPYGPRRVCRNWDQY